VTGATLRVVEQIGPTKWKWEFADAERSTRSEVRLNPTSPDHQVLLERAALAQRMPGVELRAELTRQLAGLLTDELADCIAGTAAPRLYVSGPRASHVALSLPFELLFRPDSHGAVIRVVSNAKRPVPYSPPPSAGGRVVAGFALRTEDQYLPLHSEAGALAEIAGRAAVPYDELFVVFTAEDLLRIAHDASVVHLAGHGHEGAMACYWPHGTGATTLSSADLIEAWREGAPDLVVLNFCESSSEADMLRLIEATHGSNISLQEYSARLVSSAPGAASSSMALDLAAALPTAVLALRTSADDAQARAFSRSFHTRHLLHRLSVEDAYAETLAEDGFHDDAGLPIPTLYLGEAGPPSRHEETARSGGARARVGCLEPEQRRWVNRFHRVTAPLGSVLDADWLFFVGGSSELRPVALDAIQSAISLADEVRGTPDLAAPSTEIVGDHHHLLTRRPGSEEEAELFGFSVHVESLPTDATIGELLGNRRGVAFSDLSLVARATCDVPMVLDAVLECDLGEIAARLRRAPASHSLIVDRETHWTLARELIASLPAERAASISRWAEAKWRAVESLGPLAIDVAAARYLLGGDGWRFDRTLAALSHLAAKTGVEPRALMSKLDKLTAAGVVVPAPDTFEDGLPQAISVDLLTASRAWANCSQAAAEAYMEHMLEKEMSALPTADFIAGVDSWLLAVLAELCLALEDPRLSVLLEALAAREDGAALAAALLARADAGTLARIEAASEAPDDSWRRWDRLYQSGKQAEAEALLDVIDGAPDSGREHPLRVAVNRLALASGDRPEERLREATALEDRLVAMLGDPGDDDLELGFLLAVSQVKARALSALGDHDAADDVLVDNFVQTREHSYHPATYVFAGGSAISLLAQRNACARARALWESIEAATRDMPVSPAKIFALAAELQLLMAEGRWLQARPAAHSLLDELGSWQEPRADMARVSVELCARALVGKAHGFVLLALREMVQGEAQNAIAANLSQELLTEINREIALEEALAAAADVCARIPRVLEILEVDPGELRERVRSDRREVAEAAPRGLGEIMLGEAARGILAARAADGCLLSETLIAYSDFDDLPPPGSREDASFPELTSADFERLECDHGSLQDALAHLWTGYFRETTPVLTEAFGGDVEARVLSVGLILGDLVSDERDSPATDTRVALIGGDGAAAQRAFRGGGPLKMLANLAIAIEQCHLAERGGSAPGDDRLEKLAAEQWRQALSQTPRDSRMAAATLRALACAFGPVPKLFEAIRPSAQAGDSLSERLEVAAGAGDALAGEVLAGVAGSAAVRVALATAALDGEEAEPAIALLRHLGSASSGATAVEAWRSLLHFHLERKERAECAGAIDDLLRTIDEAGVDPPDLQAAFSTLCSAGLVAGRYDVARDAARALVEGPARLRDPAYLFHAYFNYFQAVMLEHGPDSGAAVIRQAGGDLGFSTACLIVGDSSLSKLGEDSAGPLVEALRAAGADGRPDPLAGPLRFAREKLLEQLEQFGRWPELRALTRQSLEDA
jgi:hypothetical protein